LWTSFFLVLRTAVFVSASRLEVKDIESVSSQGHFMGEQISRFMGQNNKPTQIHGGYPLFLFLLEPFRSKRSRTKISQAIRLFPPCFGQKAEKPHGTTRTGLLKKNNVNGCLPEIKLNYL
jgi:hypothetical protein